jgi:CHAT domain
LVRILLLSADPIDGDRLKVQEEFFDIRRRLRSVLREDEIYLQPSGAMSLKDLQEDFLQNTPNVVHFSGHGSKNGKLVFKNSITGLGEAASIEDLARFFELDKARICCVVLNACYAEEQAKAIAEHIDCTIGMANDISDKTAIIFATIFYLTLAKGRSVKEAFSRGLLQLQFEKRSDVDTIKLKPREGVDCSRIIPVKHVTDTISDQGIGNLVGQMFQKPNSERVRTNLNSMLEEVPTEISLREFWEEENKGNLRKRLQDLLDKGILTDHAEDTLRITLARVPVRLGRLKELSRFYSRKNIDEIEELQEEVISMYRRSVEIVKGIQAE